VQLDLGHNEIENIEALANLKNLAQLNLRCNCITTLEPIRHLRKLIQLDLGYNRISKLSAIKFLTSLSALSLRSNHITDVTALRFLKNLVLLNLRFNQIKDISPLKELSCLIDLNLKDNLIEELPDWVMSFELELKLASLEDKVSLDVDSMCFSTSEVIEKNKLHWGDDSVADEILMQTTENQAYLVVLESHEKQVQQLEQEFLNERRKLESIIEDLRQLDKVASTEDVSILVLQSLP
jgi:Leucine-rich repeat (LRR) protein